MIISIINTEVERVRHQNFSCNEKFPYRREHNLFQCSQKFRSHKTLPPIQNYYSRFNIFAKDWQLFSQNTSIFVCSPPLTIGTVFPACIL